MKTPTKKTTEVEMTLEDAKDTVDRWAALILSDTASEFLQRRVRAERDVIKQWLDRARNA